MKKWICVVCLKEIDNENKPLACPLCGANGDYIVEEGTFKGFPEKINEKTRQNLNAALTLEQNATKNYFQYAKEAEQTGDKEAAVLFTALAKIEAGHQTSIRKMLEAAKE
jgi:rubrerythrin